MSDGKTAPICTEYLSSIHLAKPIDRNDSINSKGIMLDRGLRCDLHIRFYDRVKEN